MKTKTKKETIPKEVDRCNRKAQSTDYAPCTRPIAHAGPCAWHPEPAMVAQAVAAVELAATRSMLDRARARIVELEAERDVAQETTTLNATMWQSAERELGEVRESHSALRDAVLNHRDAIKAQSALSYFEEGGAAWSKTAAVVVSAYDEVTRALSARPDHTALVATIVRELRESADRYEASLGRAVSRRRDIGGARNRPEKEIDRPEKINVDAGSVMP